MKTKICSFFLALIVAVTAVVPFAVSADDLNYDSVTNNTTFLDTMAGGADMPFLDLFIDMVGDILDNGVENNNNIVFDNAYRQLQSIKIPSYTFVTGKTRLMCTGMSPIMVECTFIWSPDIIQDVIFSHRAKNPADYLYYPVNCPVFTIKRSTGTSRYVLIPYLSSNSEAFTTNISFFSDHININGIVGNGGKTKCYQWDGENNFVETSYSFLVAGTGLSFYTNSVNSIVTDMDGWGYNSSSSRYYDCYTPSPVSFKQRQRLLAEGPSDYDILLNKITVDRRGTGQPNANGDIRQPTDYWSYSNGRYKLYTSWINTNDSNVHHNLEMNWTQNNQKVYNYNSTTVGGTIINNDNKDVIYNGAFSPAFDLDVGDLAELLDSLKDLMPDIKFGLDSIFDDLKLDLFDKLGEFYGEMPDIDSEWSVDPELNNNNYLDVSPPQLPDNPSGGGDVTVNVTVDITRPEVPAVTTENWLEIEFPTTETGTYPSYITSNAQNLWNITDRLLSPSGLIAIFVLLGFGGIAVSILFKGV